ncbi:unnamed protein product, partial [Mesorhabditis belari]|uniref:Protein kinase domain-containing protein n=1 Tax=Mesorhabditis belari TaxID=2138241 RepID=A0AAF3EL33_9BILA
MGKYKVEDTVTAQRINDGQVVHVHLTNLELFSSGAFSNVYRGRAEDLQSSSIKREVAIKKTWKLHRANEVTDIDAISEIRILKLLNRLNHKNIVQLLYDFANGYKERTCYGLVFEFLPETLHSYMKARRRQLELIDIKLFTWQLFRGQAHLTKACIMHRDIKPQNLLVEPVSGLLKISDFGSSAVMKREQRQPPYHVTRYYRPPELLLEAKNYGTEVDVWSCGCVFGEMLAGRTLLPGRNSEHQLDLIIEHFGIPTRDQAASMHCPVRTYNKILDTAYHLTGSFPKLYRLIPDSQPKAAVQLLAKVLVYSPPERNCGLSFLLDPFFNDLFKSTTRRNHRPIECLSLQDLTDRVSSKRPPVPQKSGTIPSKSNESTTASLHTIQEITRK